MEEQELNQAIKPPTESKGILQWLKENLFNTWYNTLLTVLAFIFLYFVLKGILIWVFTEAKWGVIPANLRLFMVGIYPSEEIWRVWIVICSLSVLAGLSAGIWGGLIFRFAFTSGGVGVILALMPFNLWTRVWILGAVLLLIGFFFLGRGRERLRPWVLGGWFLSFPWTICLLHGLGTFPSGETWQLWIVLYSASALAGLSAGVWGRYVFVFIFVFAAALVIIGGGVLLAVMTPSLLTGGLILGMVVLFIGLFFFGRGKERYRPWILGGWLLLCFLTIGLLKGFGMHPTIVRTTSWGGLLLTLILAVVGIVVSFPLGVLLAIGRQSTLPTIKWVSTAYIEIVRGVPLVTLLFMAQNMAPIFLHGFEIDKILRAMIGLTLFSAAYMAENVRGGLQAIPRGQHEAARAVGLSYPLTMLFIILPQALRSVIPAIVGQFIALFKDTSLVYIVALLDLLGITRNVLGNPEWLGLQAEVYIFVALIYFVFSYSMSYISRRIETALGVGKI